MVILSELVFPILPEYISLLIQIILHYHSLLQYTLNHHYYYLIIN